MQNGAATFPSLLWRRLRRPAARFSWLTAVAVLSAGMIALPIIVVIASLFMDGAREWDHVSRYVLWPMVFNSTILALGTGIGVLIIGVGTAWLTTMCRFPGRRLFEWALILPLAAPAYVLAYVYADFLQHSGPVQTFLRDMTGWGPRDYWFPNIRSREGAILIFSSVFYPYVYLLARSAFLQQSMTMLEASRSLGCTPFQSFWRIGLPMARPAIAVGTALALMETLADFGATSHFNILTYTTGIYRTWYTMGDRILATQLSAALLATVFLLLLIERYNRGSKNFHDRRGRYQALTRYELKGMARWLAPLACALPVMLGFALPTVLLIIMTATNGHDLFGARYVGLALNSVTLAGLAAFIAVLLAVVLGYSQRLWPGAFSKTVTSIAGLGYAIPGTVVAVGVAIPLGAFDNALDGFTRDYLGFSTGLIFMGTVAALVFAYIVRFLSISIGSVDAALARVTPNMEAAARSLGAGPMQTLRRVHVPLLTGGMLTGVLIVFVEVMKELPATLMLRPFNFDTLALQAYRLASDERLAQASTASLTIVAVGLLPVILLSRTIAQSRPDGASPEEEAALRGNIPSSL